MIKIHIITRCTRPENLTKIEKSIFNTDKFKITWHICVDTSKLSGKDFAEKSNLIHQFPDVITYAIECDEGDYGHDMINLTIDKIKDGFIYIIDDDNIIHPDFYNTIHEQISIDPNKSYIFNQKVGGNDFTGIDVRKAAPENIHVGGIDMAQFLLKRDIIGESRLAPSTYTADGIFIEKLYKNNIDSFLLIDRILCYYNYLKKPPVFLPRILVVGEEDVKLESKFFVDYEDTRLNTLCVKDDSDIENIIQKFNPDSIISIGSDFSNFPKLSLQSLDIRNRWLHFNEIGPEVGEAAYQCATNYILKQNSDFPSLSETPLISFFTPIYNTGDVVYRTYESVKNQSYSNWEWVIVNDSTDDGKTLEIAEKIAETDPRVKVYDFKKKSGGVVGESKYRAASLCIGSYLMELDHDDYLTNDAAYWMVEAFKAHPESRFVYSDCVEIDTNKNSLTYGEGFSFGYGSYRDEIYDGVLYKVANQPNINPKTIRHIVGVPNHFRAWERSFYHSIGGHNRRLTIADDYELLVRTFLNTIMVKIPKLLYLQYYHGSNTQDASRKDIQRRVKSIANYYNERIRLRFRDLGVIDWAYEGNPESPLLTPSKFGSEENYVNQVMKFKYDDIHIELEREFII